jgi:hypothetical protein
MPEKDRARVVRYLDEGFTIHQTAKALKLQPVVVRAIYNDRLPVFEAQETYICPKCRSSIMVKPCVICIVKERLGDD